MTPRFTSLALLAMLTGCAAADADAELEDAIRASMDPGASRVEVVTLQPSLAGITLDLPGEIAGSEDAVLGSPTGGFIESVKVSAGDEVRKGDALVSVDTASRRAQLEQASAQLDRKKADLVRVEALGDLGAVAGVDRARSDVRLAQAQVDLAAIQARRATIRAPFSGVVGELGATAGEIASPGVPLLRLVKLDPVEVRLSVSDRDVVALREGDMAWVGTAARGDLRQGRIARVSPVADLSTRSFVVEVSVANPDRDLLPGMIARVRIERNVASGAVVIPQDWLVTRLDGYGVFVVEEGGARWRDVQLGDVVRGQVVVDGGLSAGDRIVVTGQHGLVDGDALLISREGTCCTEGRPTFGAIQ